MKSFNHDIVTIIEQASTITNRLSDDFLPIEDETCYHIANLRLKKWCQVIAQGNQELFNKCLSWDNLDTTTVIPLLKNVRLINQKKLPTWGETLQEIITTANSIPFQYWQKSPFPWSPAAAGWLPC